MEYIKYFLLWCLTPVQRVMQHIGKAETKITKAQVDRLMSKIIAGDILLSYETQRLTSLFIKGDWDHAAIVTKQQSVIESIGSGVREVPLEEWLYKKDAVKVKRTYLSDDVRRAAASYALRYLGYAYNFTFSYLNPFHLNAKRKGVYCSQLVYECYVLAMPMFMKLMKPKAEILPIDFEMFETIDDTKLG